MSTFKEKVRKEKIIQPTHRGFKLGTWREKWDEETDKSKSDYGLFLAGNVIYEVLEDIRNALSELYKNSPNITNEDLLKIFVSISNRNRAIISKTDPSSYQSIYSATIKTPIAGNDLTFQEVADNCVDGYEKAILNCVRRIEDKKELQHSESPIDILEFTLKETQLSQLYSAHESYWRSLLWGEFTFRTLDEHEKIYAIVQDGTQQQIDAEYSHIRKQKLAAQISQAAIYLPVSERFSDDKYISRKKSGRKQKFCVSNVTTASATVIQINSDWRCQQSLLGEQFPTGSLNTKTDQGFNITEILNIFRCLVILSWELTEKYPQNDGFKNAKQLQQFCPRVKKLELAKALEKSTSYPLARVLEILNFLEYRGETDQDLWCHPILLIGNEYIILTSSLITPAITRVVEHWFVKMKLELTEKGETYESTIISQLNIAISRNELIDNYDNGVCRRIKLLNGEEEEIDLLLRIGNTILIGEAKSIVTSDSPISQHRTAETLRTAATQILRKKEFLTKNIEAIFASIGWDYEGDVNYKIVSCIINSGRMFVGSSINEIPVVDETILTAYFNSNEIPLISSSADANGDVVHLAKYTIYENFLEAQHNLEKYLNSPPQLHNFEDGFKQGVVKLPPITEQSAKIIFSRLIPIHVPPQEVLKRASVFPLQVVDNIDEEIAKMDVYL